MADQVYVATESGSCDVKGDSVVFIKGVTMVAEGHPLLKACPDYFKPVEENHNFNAATIVHHDDGSGAPAWETEGDEYGRGTGADATGEASTDESDNEDDENSDEDGTTGDEDESDEDDAEAPAHEDSNATEHAVALAAEHAIDLSTVTGTGTDGKILKSDVQKLIPAGD